MRSLVLAGAAVLALAAPAAAMPVVFDLTASGPFSDPAGFPPVSEPLGAVSGNFTVNDANMNGAIEDGEVSAWAFTSSGFSRSGWNFSIGHTDPGAVTTVSPGTTPVGAGLSADGLNFGSTVLTDQVSITIDLVLGEFRVFSFSELLATSGIPATADFSTVPRDVVPVPLPGGLALLATALGALAVRRWQARPA